MQRILGTVSRATVLTIVALLSASAPAAAQANADLEVYLQKFPISDGEPTGAVVTYLIDVWNYGPDDAENVVMTDILQEGVTFESTESEGCAFDEATRAFTCQLGVVAPVSGASIGLTVRMPSTPATVVHTVSVSSSTADPNPTNDSMSLSIDVVDFQLADLAVTTSGPVEPARVHRVIAFTSTVTNLGPNPAASVTWSAVPPFLVDIVGVTPSQGTCETTADEIVCELGALAVDGSATVTLEVKPQNDGFVSTFTTVSGQNDPSFFDPNDMNDFASAAAFVTNAGSSDPAFRTSTRQDTAYATFMLNPCANEIVAVNGTLRTVVSTTMNQAWNRTRSYTSYQELAGLGLTSGTAYKAIGVSKETSAVYKGFFPRGFTSVDSFKLVPEDGGDTLTIHQTTHVTINADGTFTASFDHPRLECK
jgi:uncharacterized repeat protein (TIGR01451 family)